MKIQLCFCAATEREAVAWFIPGNEPREWLDEIALWESKTEELRLYLVSIDSGEAGGVLVTGCPAPAGRKRAVPWACVAKRLFVPVDGTFDPPVTDEELGRLLPGEHDVCVWHPQSGLIRFEAEQELRVSDLLLRPSQQDTNWDRAEPGIAYAQRLVSVAADKLPSGDDVVVTGRDDIGDEGGQLGDLPPAPDEKKPGPIAKGVQSVKEWLAQGVNNLSSPGSSQHGVVGGGGSSGLWQKIDDWAQRVINQAALDSERARELRRLLNMLDNDPDQGLRKAFPFGTGDGHRGTASPTTRLGSRAVDFRMGRLTGSGPADAWDVPFEIQQQLIARYRELANRELQLGRYRRAAYIFAELIGDLRAAAQALEQGGFYLEAAALYQDRLGMPTQAAQCLERGGLLHQAAELYENQAHWEDAARVYEILGQEQEARELWERAITRCINDRDRFQAAKLTREKLGDTDRALGILDAAWHLGEPSGSRCLTEWFRINGELGRHDASAAQLAMLRVESREMKQVSTVLVSVHESYPDPRLRHQAADISRVMVAERLPFAPDSKKESLVRSLARFDRHDKLLKRDCDRFGTKLARSKTGTSQQPVRRSGAIELVFQEQLDVRLEWRAITGTSHTLYLAGYSALEKTFEVFKINWGAKGLSPDRWRIAYEQRPDLILAHETQILPDPSEPQSVIVFLHQSRQLPYRVMPHPDPGFEVRPLSGIDPAQTLAVISDRFGTIWRLANDGRSFWLEKIARDKQSVQSLADLTELFNTSLADLNTESTEIAPTFHLRIGHQRWFVARGTYVYISSPQLRLQRTIRFESPVIDIALSPDLTRPRLVVSTVSDGTYTLCDSFTSGTPRKLEVDLISARLTLSKGGHICAVDGRKCVMTQTSRGEVRECEWPEAKGRPLAVVPTPRPNVVAAVSAEGAVYGFEWT